MILTVTSSIFRHRWKPFLGRNTHIRKVLWRSYDLNRNWFNNIEQKKLHFEAPIIDIVV